MGDERYIINGRCTIKGEVVISGAKNSILPIMVASMLTNEEVVLHNVPLLNDVNVMKGLMKDIGETVITENNTLKISNKNGHLFKEIVSDEYSEKIRYSVLMLGLLLAKNKKVIMHMPGGCKLGKRPIDIHLEGLKKLGVNFEEKDDLIIGTTNGLIGNTINLRFPSVGSTENLIIASVLAKGTTVLNNVAREPEIEDLCNFLNSMGAKIKGVGNKSLQIQGVSSLNGTIHNIISDRIETATFLAAAAITKGELLIKNANVKYLFEVLRVFQEIGCTIDVIDKTIIKIKGGDIIEKYDFSTHVYPGFPTDVQPIIVPILALANGTSKISENIFIDRFAVAKELLKMGAKIVFDGINSIHVYGVENLKGADVAGKDLRAGAGLVIAALAANGKTVVHNAYQINRGYENFEEKLRNIGVDIKYESS